MERKISAFKCLIGNENPEFVMSKRYISREGKGPTLHPDRVLMSAAPPPDHPSNDGLTEVDSCQSHIRKNSEV